MAEAIERLIERLAGEAQPVRRLRPPLRRAALWLLPIAALGSAAILLFSDLAVFARRAQDVKLVIEMVATLVTGIAAVIAAFELSLPDRSVAWMLLPLPSLAVWIASSGASCYEHWVHFGLGDWTLGESTHCLRFILGIGVPLGLSLLVLLRRARPLAPVRVGALGGLGVAAIAAFLLQFFHPFDVTFMDLGVHLGAVGIVVLVSSALSGIRGPRLGAVAR
jgi:hypothetical protein